ncbi:MAG TPA: TetR/AcrR family transcriptional regulator [Gemmatimonadaceae bacterium]
MRKTQGLLHEALASLIHEKSYDSIVVKEILGRANVGRSTFYTHFRDKDELLESGLRDMVRGGETSAPTQSSGVADRVLRFSLPMFEHIERYRRASDSRVDSRELSAVHEHLRRVLVELVADDLRREGRCREENGHRVPCDLLARHVASTFLLVLNWWVESREPLPPARVDDLFLALVLPSVKELLNRE